MATNEVRIEQATLRDIDDLAPLFDAYRQFYDQNSDAEGARSFLHERINANESTVMFAVMNGMVAGFVQLYPLFSSVRIARILVLNDLYVCPDQRRHGVAGKLIQAAVDFAKSNHYSRLILETTEDNMAAQPLYEGLGWSEEKGMKHYALEVNR